jgi:hypothetical protein
VQAELTLAEIAAMTRARLDFGGPAARANLDEANLSDP